jgi:hypothetical protein
MRGPSGSPRTERTSAENPGLQTTLPEVREPTRPRDHFSPISDPLVVPWVSNLAFTSFRPQFPPRRENRAVPPQGEPERAVTQNLGISFEKLTSVLFHVLVFLPSPLSVLFTDSLKLANSGSGPEYINRLFSEPFGHVRMKSFLQ